MPRTGNDRTGGSGLGDLREAATRTQLILGALAIERNGGVTPARAALETDLEWRRPSAPRRGSCRRVTLRSGSKAVVSCTSCKRGRSRVAHFSDNISRQSSERGARAVPVREGRTISEDGTPSPDSTAGGRARRDPDHRLDGPAGPLAEMAKVQVLRPGEAAWPFPRVALEQRPRSPRRGSRVC